MAASSVRIQSIKASACQRAVARPARCAGPRACGLSTQNHAVANALVAAPAAASRRQHAARPLTVAAASNGAAVEPKKVLILGGTRFIGVYLARQLIEAGHEVTLLTRGKKPVTFQARRGGRIPDDTDESYAKFAGAVKHIAADRGDHPALKQAIGGRGFQVVYDINGREAEEVEPILAAIPDLEQYVFCSSAGVYKKSDQMPHFESDEVDFKSRHKGKLFTEELLEKRGVNWTSVRPIYIYGPLNYNPIEEHIWHRLKAGRPVPVPGSGLQARRRAAAARRAARRRPPPPRPSAVTQLGHVKDLATAFRKILGNPKAARQVYNVSGDRYVTFDGLVKACAQVMGVEPEIVHFNPKEFDFGKAKAFPLRDQHFFADAQADLDWTPEFGLLEGLADSYAKDFSRGTFRKAPDFTPDDLVLEKVKGVKKEVALA
eukprot:scaffold3.g6540.t1